MDLSSWATTEMRQISSEIVYELFYNPIFWCQPPKYIKELNTVTDYTITIDFQHYSQTGFYWGYQAQFYLSALYRQMLGYKLNHWPMTWSERCNAKSQVCVMIFIKTLAGKSTSYKFLISMFSKFTNLKGKKKGKILTFFYTFSQT